MENTNLQMQNNEPSTGEFVHMEPENLRQMFPFLSALPDNTLSQVEYRRRKKKKKKRQQGPGKGCYTLRYDTYCAIVSGDKRLVDGTPFWDILRYMNGDYEDISAIALEKHPEAAYVGGFRITPEASGLVADVIAKQGNRVVLNPQIKVWSDSSGTVLDRILRQRLVAGVLPEVMAGLKREINQAINGTGKRLSEREISDEFRKHCLTSSDQYFLQKMLAEDNRDVEPALKYAENGHIRIDQDGLTFDYDPVKDQFKAVFNPAEMILALYDKCEGHMDGFAQFLKSIRYPVKTRAYKTFCRITVYFGTFTDTFDIRFEDMGTALETARQQYAGDEKKLQEMIEERQKSGQRKANANPYYGNLMAICLLDLIMANPEVNLSEAALADALRGTGKSQRYYIELVKYAGQFSLVSREEVSAMLNSLCSIGLLRSKQVTGKYTDYTAYKIQDEVLCGIFRAVPERDGYDKYTDLNWLQVIKNEGFGEEQVREKMTILDHTALYCAEPELFVQYISEAPEQVKQYIRMASKIGMNDGKKKLCRKLAEKIK